MSEPSAPTVPRKPKDTRYRANLLVNAYLEAVAGVFALRLPEVQVIVREKTPTMAVASSYPNEAVIIDAKRIVDECKLAGHEIEATLNQISGMFVAAMWDTLVSHANYDKISTEPEVQFFRHLRNACGHDGRWNFSKLSHVAQWRDKELTEAHAGQVVFGGLLTQGDVVVLVTDIDKQYFERPPTAKNDA